MWAEAGSPTCILTTRPSRLTGGGGGRGGAAYACALIHQMLSVSDSHHPKFLSTIGSRSFLSLWFFCLEQTPSVSLSKSFPIFCFSFSYHTFFYLFRSANKISLLSALSILSMETCAIEMDIIIIKTPTLTTFKYQTLEHIFSFLTCMGLSCLLCLF